MIRDIKGSQGVCIVGVSGGENDRAKMNRFSCLSGGYDAWEKLNI